MKRLFSAALIAVLFMSLAACGNKGSLTTESSDNASDIEDTTSDMAEPEAELSAEETVLRDMSADIANPNTEGCSSYDLAADGFAAMQNDWLYYVNDAGIHRTSAQTLDFSADELIWAPEDSLNLKSPYLNVAGKYLYFTTNDRRGGYDLRQYDMETGELIVLTEGDNRYYSVFYLNGYLYYSIKGAYSAQYDALRLMRMAVPCTDSNSVPEELFCWPASDWHFTPNQEPPRILGTYNGQLLLLVNTAPSVYMFGTVEGNEITPILDTSNVITPSVYGIYLRGDELVGCAVGGPNRRLIYGNLTEKTIEVKNEPINLYNIYLVGDTAIYSTTSGLSLMQGDKQITLTPDSSSRTIPVGDLLNGGILYRPDYDNSSPAPLYFAPYSGSGAQKIS